MKELTKKLICECIGTFVLVFCACGVAMATYGSLLSTSLTFGLVIVAMAYSIGRISGCHINPAVSFGCFLTKRMTLKEFLLYCAAQCVGGLVGAILVTGLFRMAGISNIGDACNTLVGYGNSNNNVFGGVVAALLTETVLTCIFVYVILNVTDDKATEGDEYKRGTSQIAGILIGLTLTLVHLIGINLTGTSVNPARSIATAIATLIYNGEAYALAQVVIFIVAPMAGAALAALLYNFLHAAKDKNEETKEEATTEEVTE